MGCNSFDMRHGSQSRVFLDDPAWNNHVTEEALHYVNEGK